MTAEIRQFRRPIPANVQKTIYGANRRLVERGQIRFSQEEPELSHEPGGIRKASFKVHSLMRSIDGVLTYWFDSCRALAVIFTEVGEGVDYGKAQRIGKPRITIKKKPGITLV